jgi:hypothetical protein
MRLVSVTFLPKGPTVSIDEASGNTPVSGTLP